MKRVTSHRSIGVCLMYPYMIIAMLLLSINRANSLVVSRQFSRQSSRLYSSTKNLVSVSECLQQSDKTKFVDGTWYHKGDRNGRQEFEKGPRIPNSVYFDIDDISSSTSPQTHMLPTPELFGRAMDEFGIRNSDPVVIYARKGSSFLPRIWFTFHEMGHSQVSIMQGPLEEWIQAGGAVESGHKTVPKAAEFSKSAKTTYAPIMGNRVVDLSDVKGAVEEQSATILDARGSSFQKTGGMPGSINIPYSTLAQDMTFKSRQDMTDIFQKAGVDPFSEKPIYCSCGSGVSACTLYLALQECGRRGETFMYDGSWQEWKLKQ
jgi:thiosulfate/3-mercaptopyruvate sulfurtransferase